MMWARLIAHQTLVRLHREECCHKLLFEAGERHFLRLGFDKHLMRKRLNQSMNHTVVHFLSHSPQSTTYE